MMKRWFKETAYVLIIVMLLQTVLCECAYAKEKNISDKKICTFTDTNGVSYLLELSGDKIEDCIITVTNLENYDKKIVDYNHGVVTTKEYVCVGKKFNRSKKYSEKKEKTYDIRSKIAQFEKGDVVAQGYNKSVEMIFYLYEDENGNNYSYRYAVGNGKDSGYSKISCCKSYKVRNDNDDLKNYKNAIAQSNSFFKKAGISTSVAAAVIALVFAGLFSGGATLSVAIFLASAYGITASSLNYLIDSYEWGIKADTYFEAAKLAAV